MIVIFLSMCALCDLAKGRVMNQFILFQMLLTPCLMIVGVGIQRRGVGILGTYLAIYFVKLILGNLVGILVHSLRIFGGGDCKLLALVFAMIPIRQFLLVLCMAILIGATYGVLQRLILKQSKLPFLVPFYFGMMWWIFLGGVG